MSRLMKTQSSKRTLESYGTRVITPCQCYSCVCPPASVPTDIQMKNHNTAVAARSVSTSQSIS